MVDTEKVPTHGQLPAVMTAWQYANPRGCLEKKLHLNNAAIPARPPGPGSDGVVIEVISIALNPADYKLSELPLINQLLVSKPASPGLDFCGRIVS